MATTPTATSAARGIPSGGCLTRWCGVFEKSGRVVPVFFDKHLADNFDDARVDLRRRQPLENPDDGRFVAARLVALSAGGRPRGGEVKEIVATSYHRLDTYGFHALEMVQCLAERGTAARSGVRQVRCIEGDAVWAAGRAGKFDLKLLDQAATRFRQRQLAPGETIRSLARKPVLFMVEYRDGLRASMLTMDGGADWAAAWRYADGKTDSTLFWTQEERPMMHFGFLLKDIERLVHDRRPFGRSNGRC